MPGEAFCTGRGSPRQRWPFFYEQCSEKPCAVAHCSRAKRRTVDSLTPSTSAVVFTNDAIGSGNRACSTAFIGPLCFSCLANVWIDIFCATEESVTQIIASDTETTMIISPLFDIYCAPIVVFRAQTPRRWNASRTSSTFQVIAEFIVGPYAQ